MGLQPLYASGLHFQELSTIFYEVRGAPSDKMSSTSTRVVRGSKKQREETHTFSVR